MVTSEQMKENFKQTKEGLLTKTVMKYLTVSDHALFRYQQRFDKEVDKISIVNRVKGILNQPATRYMGIQQCEKGNDSHMFYNGGKMEIYLSLDLTKVATFINPKDKAFIVQMENDNPLHNKLVNLYESELRKYKRKEITMINTLERTEKEKAVDVANLKLKAFKTKSDNIRNECYTLLSQIELEINEMINSLTKHQDNKRKIMRALASLLGQEFISNNKDDMIDNNCQQSAG